MDEIIPEYYKSLILPTLLQQDAFMTNGDHHCGKE